MKTYLSLFFNSEGAPPNEIDDVLKKHGFKPIMGTHDYVYEWSDEVSVEEVVAFSDKVHEDLRGCDIYYRIETISHGIKKLPR